MDNRICYLNTDLDLISADDLTAIANAFKDHGCTCLQAAQHNGLWYARFENRDEEGDAELITYTSREPEGDVAGMLAVIESFSAPLKSAWERCTLREFNIGYDCGAEPWAFNQGLSASIMGQMASIGASLRVTLYPEREAKTPWDILFNRQKGWRRRRRVNVKQLAWRPTTPLSFRARRIVRG